MTSELLEWFLHEQRPWRFGETTQSVRSGHMGDSAHVRHRWSDQVVVVGPGDGLPRCRGSGQPPPFPAGVADGQDAAGGKHDLRVSISATPRAPSRRRQTTPQPALAIAGRASGSHREPARGSFAHYHAKLTAMPEGGRGRPYSCWLPIRPTGKLQRAATGRTRRLASPAAAPGRAPIPAGTRTRSSACRGKPPACR